MDEELQEKEALMKCIHCKGMMKKGSSPFHVDRDGYHLSFDRVPAWICTQCGEAYFEENEVEAIQDVISTIDRRAAKLAASA